ncbi:MAG: hypothetical protein DWQ40_04310 [Actinobacteria bacterium]|nr:MAG: hypothetical protein DWQ40_04310 [Actinomycetota bacterium]
MDDQREEVYERIPWETLEEKGRDRQWLVLGVAGAVVAGALAYSFVTSRPVGPQPLAAVATTVDSSLLSPAPAPPIVPSTVSPAPTNVSEADLYAVEPERLVEAAVAHARWFVREFLAVDGSSDGQGVLRALLPADVPLPVVPEGVLVFVEWVDSIGVEEIDLATFRVSIVARYMVSADGGEYQRMDPELFVVDIGMADGTPRALSAPEILPLQLGAANAMPLGEVPQGVADSIEVSHAGSQIVGGRQLTDGSWSVVVLVSGPAGITRPVSTVVVP